MQNDLGLIKQIVNQYIDPKKNKAFIFGSRAKQNNIRFSDYDLGLSGQEIDSETYFELQAAFEESNLPYKVDIVDFNKVSKKFQDIAEEKIIPLNY